jgi:hypothetical protein
MMSVFGTTGVSAGGEGQRWYAIGGDDDFDVQRDMRNVSMPEVDAVMPIRVCTVDTKAKAKGEG